MNKIEKLTAADIRARMRNYYGTHEWALMFEVIDATGARNTRSADAIAMNTWPSRGLSVHGIEIKVSRSDWLQELKRPDKAQTIAKYCDYWWLVAPEEIVKPGELPETWGMMAPIGNTLRVVKQAVKNEKPTDLDRLFVASLLRNAGRISEGDIAAKAALSIQTERQNIENQIEARVNQRMSHYKELREAVEKFEKDSGLRISNGWSDYNLGKRVKLVEALDLLGYDNIRAFPAKLRRKADAIDKALDECDLVNLLSKKPTDANLSDSNE